MSLQQKLLSNVQNTILFLFDFSFYLPIVLDSERPQKDSLLLAWLPCCIKNENNIIHI